MQANPDKFQAIFLGKKGITDIAELIVDNKIIRCDNSVTLLGIEFENMLTFNIVQRLRITFSSDCAFCDKSTKIGTLVVLYI